MPIVVTRDGLRTEDQLKDEAKPPENPSFIHPCNCGNTLKFPLLPQQKFFKCPMCGMDWIW